MTIQGIDAQTHGRRDGKILRAETASGRTTSPDRHQRREGDG